MYELDGEPTLDVVLQADFLGRAQSLSLEEAEARLVRSLEARSTGIMDPGDHQTLIYWQRLGYRAVAYDAAGLTATLVRMYAGSEHEIVDAHMALMRSMIVNAPEPDIGPLRLVMAKLIAS